jgi:hypothetical protein
MLLDIQSLQRKPHSSTPFVQKLLKFVLPEIRTQVADKEASRLGQRVRQSSAASKRMDDDAGELSLLENPTNMVENS